MEKATEMKYWIVDTFSTAPFEGNPAAVCWLDQDLPTELLQQMACEFNLHEIVFLSPLQNQHLKAQIFTPRANESVCGHGLLAAAHVVWSELGEVFPADATLYLETDVGIFSLSKNEEMITLLTNSKTAEPTAVPEQLINALGTPPIAVSRCGQIYVVEMFSPKHVLKLEPNLAKLEKVVCKGVVVTAEGNSEVPYDFMSRFFAPQEGFKEDSVTPWTHRFLGPYWAQRLSKTTFVAMQTARRSGYLYLECAGGQTKISGRCTTSMRGDMSPFQQDVCHGDLFHGFQQAAGVDA